MAKVNQYQYETSPRKLKPEVQPRKKRTGTDSSSKKTNTNQKTNVKKLEKYKRAKMVMYIIIGFVILFAISYRNALINENFTEKKQLQTKLSNIKKENEQLLVNIEKSLNLSTIEQSAKELLGMQKLDNSQKVYISLPKKDYVEASTEEVRLEKEQNIFEKIINIVMGK